VVHKSLIIAKLLERKRRTEESWSAIAREPGDGMGAWVVAGAILLAWLGFRFGSTRLAHMGFRTARAALPEHWRDQFADWPEFCEHARELIQEE
jgi:hypothetical protein